MPGIEHLAMWVEDLELCRDFYEKYFEGTAGEKYHNPKKNFTSYFIKFDNGSRLEIMHKPGRKKADRESFGFAHVAFSVGSKEKVDALTEQLRADGIIITGEPRTTGDGYYESVVLDPEGNPVEITI